MIIENLYLYDLQIRLQKQQYFIEYLLLSFQIEFCKIQLLYKKREKYIKLDYEMCLHEMDKLIKMEKLK